jgi:DNA-3-methyladenine glycosylase II
VAEPTPPNVDRFSIAPRGPFSLEEAGRFGFGQRMAPDWDGVMRLAFCVDGYEHQVGVEVRQPAGGKVECTVQMVPGQKVDLDAVRGQVARVLSLDHDAADYVAVGDRDPVVRRLLAAAPGLRPPLFYSPYEAAAWAIISARRSGGQMAEVRRRLSEQHGQTFELAGQSLAALPTPEQMVEIGEFPGLNAEKIERLHAVARAAQTGQLNADRLLRMSPEDAMADVQTIPGIGPFYSALIIVRATGFIDVLPTVEPRLITLITTLYDLAEPPSTKELEAIAEQWRPFRTWVSVLIRSAGPRVLQPYR